MKYRLRKYLVLFAFAVLLVSPPVLAQQVSAAQRMAFSLSISPSGVRVDGADPGGHVILYAAAIESYGGLLKQYSTVNDISDDDKDGVVTYTGRPVPLRSVWIAIDQETGSFAIGGRPDYPVRLLPFPPNVLKKDTDGIIGLMDVQGRTAELLIVRPKKGAWLVKSSITDPQVRNGKLTLTVADAKPIGGTDAAPVRLKNGDIVALINTGRLEASVMEVGK